MGAKAGRFLNILKSGFLRTVVTRVLAILIIVSIVIAGVAFYSFTTDIRKTVLHDRQKQLVAVEHTISERVEEIESIAYNIGNDPAFYLEPVDDSPNSSRMMSEMLERYVVGNSFIEHLAYCRTAEPDKLYTCKGERSLHEFFVTSFGMDDETVEWIIQQIHSENNTSARITEGGDNAFFSYAYPLPQLAQKPQAHVLMLIPVKEVKALLETLLMSDQGAVAVFDDVGNELYRTGNCEDELDLTDFVHSDAEEQEYKAASGEKYVLQKVVSETNSWTYVAVIPHSDTLSGLAYKQIAFIVFVILMLVAAIVVMLVSIVSEYKPISVLAAQIADGKQDGVSNDKVIDERTVLSDTIATLKDDSAQKQKYEAAFYEAEAASQAKSAFLSSMSHDIRTPMNAIIGMTAIARKHIGDQEYVDECLEKVQVSSDYLLDIINNVLDMSRIESGRIPLAEEPVVLPALIDNVVSLMTSSAEAKAQKIRVDMGELGHSVVLGDNIHLVQVFVNILSNAVKFTPEGGKIDIRVWQIESEDDQAGMYVFAFSDTGVGIPPEFIDHVFDTFARASDRTASEAEGTGLGMAIAKKLVELMGGTIQCESTQGHGTTFTVRLRMKYVDEEEAMALVAAFGKRDTDSSSPRDTTVDLTGKRILIVEDNAMNKEIAKRIISETGAIVEEADNGKIAVDAFSSHPAGYYDLIFMDIQMPVMDGYAATAAIRSMDKPDSKTVPICAMTANTFDEDVRRVKDAGMDGHIGKPYNPQKLNDVFVKIFGQR